MSKHALLVIDVQNDMFPTDYLPHDADGLLSRLSGLIGRARAAGVPVIYVQHEGTEDLILGTEGWQVHAAIAPQPDDLRVGKRTPDAFYQTGLHELLQQRGITHLTLCGLQTEVCVDTTTRCGFSLGYKQVLVQDGHSTYDRPELKATATIAHHNRVIGNWFAELKPAAEVAW